MRPSAPSRRSWAIAPTSSRRARSRKSWADFYDLKTFPGKRTLFKARPQYILESALLADGVDPERLYPLDIDRAFKKLDTHQGRHGLGDVDPAVCRATRGPRRPSWASASTAASRHPAAGRPGGHAVERGLHRRRLRGDPEGAKNAKEAMKLIAYMTSRRAQRRLLLSVPVAPINRNAVDQVDPSKRDVLGRPSATRSSARTTLVDGQLRGGEPPVPRVAPEVVRRSRPGCTGAAPSRRAGAEPVGTGWPCRPCLPGPLLRLPLADVVGAQPDRPLAGQLPRLRASRASTGGPCGRRFRTAAIVTGGLPGPGLPVRLRHAPRRARAAAVLASSSSCRSGRAPWCGASRGPPSWRTNGDHQRPPRGRGCGAEPARRSCGTPSGSRWG